MSSKKNLLSALVVLGILTSNALLFTPAASADSSTYIVNVNTDESDANIGDGFCDAGEGACTLRAAIEEANSNVDADTIEFNIPGGGVQTISPSSQLPTVTNPLTINGYSQPGSAVNTADSPLPMNSVITIQLKNTNNLDIFGLKTESSDVTIRGLAIDDFTDAIWIDGLDQNKQNISISGNYLGTDTTGLVAPTLQEVIGVKMINGCSNVTVGGVLPEDRNIISATNSAIEARCDDVSIFGNYIGLGRDGVTDIVDEVDGAGGLGITQPNNDNQPANTGLMVGGPTPAQRNVISGIPGVLLNIMGNDGIFQGNFLGGDYTGEANPNIDSGFGMSLVFSASGNLIGGTGDGEGNVFAGVRGAAIGVANIDIQLYSIVTDPKHNAILGNVMKDIGITPYYGFGSSNIGIDNVTGVYTGAPNGVPNRFDFTGPTPNDAGDVDSGPNEFMNSPVLNSAVQVGDVLTIDFDLDVAGSDSNQYRVEFFSNDESTVFGHGPGQNYLGSATVEPGNSNVDISLPSSADISNKALSATVTPLLTSGPEGFGSTSEFSQNIEIGSATDFDADGISDAEENAAPNSGDANDDGIQDSEQPTVSSYLIGSTYVSFTTNGCSANGSVSSLNESTLNDSDTGFTYPYGLTDFSLNCSQGNTVDITKIVFTNDNADGYSVRKYRPNTHTFEAVTDSTVTKETVGGQPALVMNYSIEDGGTLDDDGQANGLIVDPVGLAAVYVSSTPGVSNPSNNGTTTAKGTLANTGTNTDWQTPIIILELGLILLTTTRLRRNRNKRSIA